MNTTPGRVTVTLYHTNTGQARYRVQYNGRQKSVPMDYNSHDPFLTAMLDVLGRSAKINDSDRQISPWKRVVFYIDPRTAQEPTHDYSIRTYANAHGAWCARIRFPNGGAGNTPEGERLIETARRAAQTAIRREILERAPRNFELRRLRYEVIANSSNPSTGALASLTICESE